MTRTMDIQFNWWPFSRQSYTLYAFRGGDKLETAEESILKHFVIVQSYLLIGTKLYTVPQNQTSQLFPSLLRVHTPWSTHTGNFKTGMRKINKRSKDLGALLDSCGWGDIGNFLQTCIKNSMLQTKSIEIWVNSHTVPHYACINFRSYSTS